MKHVYTAEVIQSSTNQWIPLIDASVVITNQFDSDLALDGILLLRTANIE